MLSSDSIGIILGLLSAFSVSATQAILSRPLVKTETTMVAFFTVVVGFGIASVLTFSTAQVYFYGFPGIEVIALFAGVGILQYGFSRTMFYRAIRNLGANITAPIITILMIVGSVLLAVVILAEKITPAILVGIVAVLIGALLLEGRRAAGIRGGNTRGGYTSAITAGTIPAFTAIMISYGLSLYSFVIPSVFIAYSAALIYYIIVKGPQTMIRFVRSTPRRSLGFFLLAGVTAIAAQLLRVGSLDYAPVVLVIPFLTSSNLFTPLLTWKLAGDVEVFNLRTVLGIVVITAGLVVITI